MFDQFIWGALLHKQLPRTHVIVSHTNSVMKLFDKCFFAQQNRLTVVQIEQHADTVVFIHYYCYKN